MSDHEYLPPSGRGPAILVIAPDRAIPLQQQASDLAADGYVVSTTTPENLIDAFQALSVHAARVGNIAAVATGSAAGAAFDLAQSGRIAALALYDPDLEAARLRTVRCPVVVHVSGGVTVGSPAPQRPRPQREGRAEFYLYRDATPGFYDPDSKGWDPYMAGIAYSRSLALFRRELGPHYNLNDLWDYHLACDLGWPAADDVALDRCRDL